MGPLTEPCNVALATRGAGACGDAPTGRAWWLICALKAVNRAPAKCAHRNRCAHGCGNINRAFYRVFCANERSPTCLQHRSLLALSALPGGSSN